MSVDAISSKQNLVKLQTIYLKNFPTFFNFLNGSISTQTSSKNNSSALISETQPTISPEEEVDQAFNTWKDNFLEELLDQVKQLAWDKFE